MAEMAQWRRRSASEKAASGISKAAYNKQYNGIKRRHGGINGGISAGISSGGRRA
jgi:hypothetical protein